MPPRNFNLRLSIVGLLLAIVFKHVSGSKNIHNYKGAHIKGNITLGGLFPIHSQDKNGNCTIINGVLGIQRLEAMFFAVRRINEENKILPGIKLGLSAFDTCASETIALDRTVEEFITDQKCGANEEDRTIGERQVKDVFDDVIYAVSSLS